MKRHIGTLLLVENFGRSGKGQQFVTVLVTGGAGFIGSNFVHSWLGSSSEAVINLDKLTYAGNISNLASFKDDERHTFVCGDIGDRALVTRLLSEYRPTAIINFAAESHVDRSIHNAADFIQTNVVGTFNLLEVVRSHWLSLPAEGRSAFRFLHVSTDEVYGTLGPDDAPFSESKSYEPNSPYSASKAASDHLVRAWHHTYGFACTHDELQQQLWTLSFSGKADPFSDSQCSRGEGVANLWRWSAGP